MRRRCAELFDALGRSVVDGEGASDPGLRRAVLQRAESFSRAPPGEVALPEPLSSWTDKVARHAYRCTDADVEALKAAGHSEDEIFELTLSAALGAALGRLERGMSVHRAVREGREDR